MEEILLIQIFLQKIKSLDLIKTDIKTRIVAIKIIRDVLVFKKKLKSATSKYLSNDFSSLDIRFVIELSKGTIRMSKRIEYEISKYYNGKIKKLEKLYLVILQSAIYQIDYMSTVPNYAVVSTSVNITKVFFPKYAGLTNALLRNMISNRDVLDKPSRQDSVKYLSTYYSHPEWLVTKWSKKYKFNSLVKLLNYNNSHAEVWFRYNENKVSFDDIKSNFNKKEYELRRHPDLNNFFTINKSSYILNSQLFQKGGISVQSPTNGLIIKLLDPLKNETVLDLCASPGGKTVAIADCMSGIGNIIAHDINEDRIALIIDSIKRNKISNVKAEIKDCSNDILLQSSKMIADVPCLGTGTISKNPDLKWKKTINDLSELTNLQEDILQNCSKYLKSNGVLVYSTCSIEEEENWMMIDKFLDKHPNYIVDNAKKYVDSKFTDSKGAINIKPHIHNMDGGFAVRLINYES